MKKKGEVDKNVEELIKVKKYKEEKEYIENLSNEIYKTILKSDLEKVQQHINAIIINDNDVIFLKKYKIKLLIFKLIINCISKYIDGLFISLIKFQDKGIEILEKLIKLINLNENVDITKEEITEKNIENFLKILYFTIFFYRTQLLIDLKQLLPKEQINIKISKLNIDFDSLSNILLNSAKYDSFLAYLNKITTEDIKKYDTNSDDKEIVMQLEEKVAKELVKIANKKPAIKTEESNATIFKAKASAFATSTVSTGVSALSAASAGISTVATSALAIFPKKNPDEITSDTLHKEIKEII